MKPTPIAVINSKVEERVPVESLKLHPKNDREGDVGAISESIDAVGFYGAIVAQLSTGYILKGNHTYKSLLEMGQKTVPLVIWIEVSDEDALRILLGDNHIADRGGYNVAQTIRNLIEIKQRNPAKLVGTGYSPDDIKSLQRNYRRGLKSESAKVPKSRAIVMVICPCCSGSFSGYINEESYVEPIDDTIKS